MKQPGADRVPMKSVPQPGLAAPHSSPGPQPKLEVGVEKSPDAARKVRAPHDDQLNAALEKAFDYRGDVTITRIDGSKIEGYVFDRHDSFVRLFPKEQPDKVTIPYSEIADVEFTGRDTAAGKSWEAWVKKYLAKKAAGERQIEIKPESLDE